MKQASLLISFFCIFYTLQGQHHIIPEPVLFESTNEIFTIDNQLDITLLSTDEKTKITTALFQAHLKKLGITSTISSKKEKNGLQVILHKKPNKVLGNEGYTLEVKSKYITLKANTNAGLFNGFQTLKQLLPASKATGEVHNLNIPGCIITDYPRFKWRGLMFDVSRHFYTVDEVKAYIDQMAAYKFNVFHWHLTDDNGWRIEIKAFPKLTEVGAWRVERTGRFGDQRPAPQPDEPTTYGGFYTQEDIKDVIQYAEERNITVVPEIDVPGHSMALLAAYPEYGTTNNFRYVSPGNKFAEWYGNGEFEMFVENMLNPANEKVYTFLDQIFTEIAALFPSEYIHMGGDECYQGFWEKNQEIQEFMKRNNLKDTHALQNYFINRVDQIISSKGKTMIGWDEILDSDLSKNAAVMSWRGMEGGIKAAKAKHQVVMSPTTYCYLDYAQGDHSVENWIYDSLNLKKTYEFEPVPEGVDPKYILGGQGNLWTEAVPKLSFAYYMTYPRAFSIAETLWSSKESKNWSSFFNKTEKHFDRFDSTNTNVCKAVYDPIVKVSLDGEKLMCELSNNVPGSEVYYTVNNTYPVQFGDKYQGSFEIPEGDVNLRTQCFRNGKPVGRVLVLSRATLIERVKK